MYTNRKAAPRAQELSNDQTAWNSRSSVLSSASEEPCASFSSLAFSLLLFFLSPSFFPRLSMFRVCNYVHACSAARAASFLLLSIPFEDNVSHDSRV